MTMLVLASASEARARLLAAAGVAFDVKPAAIDEETYRLNWMRSGHSPTELAPALAREKALAAGGRTGQVILACDQVLLLDDEPVGKSANESEARELLRRLRGREHALVTAVVLAADGRLVWQHTAVCRLVMRSFTDSFLDEYVSRAGDALTGCVGCYRLEALGVQLFERMEGDFFSVLGLPLLPLLAQLRKMGLVQS